MAIMDGFCPKCKRVPAHCCCPVPQPMVYQVLANPEAKIVRQHRLRWHLPPGGGYAVLQEDVSTDAGEPCCWQDVPFAEEE